MIGRCVGLSMLLPALVAAGGCGRQTGPGELVYSPFHHNAHNAIVQVRQPAPRVALTFDDGPDPHTTPGLVRFLERRRVPATFFVIGLRVLRYPDLVRLERRHGHEIENHTFRHPNLRRLSREAISAEIARGASAIEASDVPRPRLFRPPLGAFDERVGLAVAERGDLMVGWDLPLDRFVDRMGVKRGVRVLLSRVRPGSIVLAHAERSWKRRRTRRALNLLISGLRERGFTPVTLGELLAGHAPAGTRTQSPRS